MVENEIEDIEIFEKVDFKNLEYLSLNGNKIKSIEVFSKVKFLNLERLDLENNQISRIDVLINLPFTNLLHLGLRDNKFNPKDEKVLKIVEELEKKYKDIDVAVAQPEKGPLGC